MRVMRTNQLKVGDVEFYKGGCQIPRNSPLHLILQADFSTLKITHQNNGCMVQTIHHKSFSSDLYPCKALARQIRHILTNSGSTESYICEYRVTRKYPFAKFTPTDLITTIRLSVLALKIHHNGINPYLVGVLSLRSGGWWWVYVSEAAWGKQNHHHEDSRWYILTFLMYIHNKIGHISKVLAQTMSRPTPLLNIDAIET